jgi:hypothetical protein
MTNEEDSGLILAITRVLYVNGQATDQVVAAGQRSATSSASQPTCCRAGASCSCGRPVEG